MTRLLSFLLVALFSLWVSFFWFGEGTLHFVVVYLAYPSLFITFGMFLFSLYEVNREEFSLSSFIPRKRSAWLAIGLVTGLLILFEPFQFKIVYDELILSVSAEFLHFNRLAGVPREANDYMGSYMLMDAILDKRPFFFPFLLGTVHDVTGYRYENAFYLNAFLTLVLITLSYVLGKVFSGHRGGLLAVLLAGTLPLLGIFATSGHFEVLNLVMMSIVVLLAYLYIDKPDDRRLIALVYSLILLCQVRYENGLYLLPFGLLILIGWKKAGRVILPFRALICPIFLILFAMQFKMIQTASHGFFQEGPNGRLETFALSYAPENLLSAVRFFFATTQNQPNSYLLSVFGFSSLFAYCYYAFRRARFLTGRDPKGTTIFILTLSVFLFSLVIAFFNYGMFDRFITSRLSLPLHLYFIILTPYVFKRLGRNYIMVTLLFGLICAAITFSSFDRAAILKSGSQFSLLLLGFIGCMYWLWKKAAHPDLYILAIPIVYILTVTMPWGHAQRFSGDYKSNDILMEQIRFIEERKDHEKILFVAGNQYAAMLTKTNTTFIDVLNAYPKVAKEHLKRRMYTEIYVSRRFERTQDDEWKLVMEEHYLDPDVFILEPVYVKHLKPNVILEFSRLVNVVLPEDEIE